MRTDFMKHEIYPLIQETLHIPIYRYRNDTLIDCYPPQSPLTYPPLKHVKKIRSQLMEEDKLYMIYSTEYFVWYAGIRIAQEKDSILIIGPITSISYNEQTYLRLYIDYVVSDHQKDLFRLFIQNIPCMDYYNFIRKVQLIHYICNRDKIDGDTTMLWLNQPPISVSPEKESFMDTSIHSDISTSLDAENILFSYIRFGNVKALKHFMCNIPSYKHGKMADNNLRQEKNSFIITIALACRAALQGGLPEDIAFQLSDQYIQQVERSTDVNQLTSILVEVLLDYTSRVENQSFPTAEDHLIQKCIHFIRANVNHKITTQDIADYVGYSRSYISTKFKHEMGFDLSGFIIRCKLEKAKMMLKSTNHSINEISHLLCFANQSHFQSHFKRQYNMTPLEYRNAP